MKRLSGYGQDDHPEGGSDKARTAWSVVAMDDCEECGDLRIELTLEDVGSPGAGTVAHLAPATVRQLVSALNSALRDIGEG